ncbi:MAG TPA: baseplate J/gp47 family protein, partial [Ktedonobacteraceae bacterium]|nr:baseplate J/gp47 family protein [Ktedonobacteraceae bacterium]
ASIKRHTRLLDYVLHEGCNARVWVHMRVSGTTTLPRGTQLLPRLYTQAVCIAADSPVYEDALRRQMPVFETMQQGELYEEHNEIAFFLADNQDATLAAGCTSALLSEPGVPLAAGQALLFEEVKGSATGDPLDADPTHRHVVRLSRVTRGKQGTAPVVFVEWAVEDALPFDLTLAIHRHGHYLTGITVARGNMLLADHGRTIAYEQLEPPDAGTRYHPRLSYPALTYAVPEDEVTLARPASLALSQRPREAMPALMLFERQDAGEIALTPELVAELGNPQISTTLRQIFYARGIRLSDRAELLPADGSRWEIHDDARDLRLLLNLTAENTLSLSALTRWTLRRELINSFSQPRVYTVDAENSGYASLRFDAQTAWQTSDIPSLVCYRTGNGTQGNLNAEALAYVVTRNRQILQVRNPLPAQGAINAQDQEEARSLAPFAFQEQRRGVTESDYARLACHHPRVANAIARLRWTGSGYTMFVFIQPSAGQMLDATLRATLAQYLEQFRVVGHNIKICEPVYAALHMSLRIRLKPGAYHSVVRRMLEQAFSHEPQGFFYADNFTFGQTVYVSQIIARAMEIRGVARVEVTRFDRVDATEASTGKSDSIRLSPLEIIRLDNDPHVPRNGIIQMQIEGNV